MNKTTLPIALLILLISGLLTACESDGNPAPDCVVGGTHIAAGDKIPSDECGGCACTDEGQIQCIDAQCTPESTYEPAEDDGACSADAPALSAADAAHRRRVRAAADRRDQVPRHEGDDHPRAFAQPDRRLV